MLMTFKSGYLLIKNVLCFEERYSLTMGVVSVMTRIFPAYQDLKKLEARSYSIAPHFL